MTAPLHPLMLPPEVAEAFHVDLRTVGRWAQEGKLSFIRLPHADGLGEHRFLRAEVDAQLAGTPLTREQVTAAWAAYRAGGGR